MSPDKEREEICSKTRVNRVIKGRTKEKNGHWGLRLWSPVFLRSDRTTDSYALA